MTSPANRHVVATSWSRCECRYPDFEPSAEINDLLDEIDDDPTCIFWG